MKRNKSTGKKITKVISKLRKEKENLKNKICFMKIELSWGGRIRNNSVYEALEIVTGNPTDF